MIDFVFRLEIFEKERRCIGLVVEMVGLGLRELGIIGLRVIFIGFGGLFLGNVFGVVKEEDVIVFVYEVVCLGINYFDVFL